MAGISEDRNGEAIEADRRDRAVEMLRLEMTEAFGGSSVHQVDGGWMNPAGIPVYERGVVAISYVDISFNRAEDAARSIAIGIKHRLDQESVMVLVEAVPEMIHV